MLEEMFTAARYDGLTDFYLKGQEWACHCKE